MAVCSVLEVLLAALVVVFESCVRVRVIVCNWLSQFRVRCPCVRFCVFFFQFLNRFLSSLFRVQYRAEYVLSSRCGRIFDYFVRWSVLVLTESAACFVIKFVSILCREYLMAESSYVNLILID